MTHYLDAAIVAARAAGDLLRRNFQQPLRVNASEAHDIKLEIDVESQELITNLLLKKFPHHALYGEEGIVGDQASEFQWVVDPLDGTVNYFYGIPHFCVSKALRSTWLMSHADGSMLTSNRALVCGTSPPVGFWSRVRAEPSRCDHALT